MSDAPSYPRFLFALVIVGLVEIAVVWIPFIREGLTGDYPLTERMLTGAALVLLGIAAALPLLVLIRSKYPTVGMVTVLMIIVLNVALHSGILASSSSTSGLTLYTAIAASYLILGGSVLAQSISNRRGVDGKKSR